MEDERLSIFPRWTADGKSVVYAARSLLENNIEIRRISASGGHPEKLVSTDVVDTWGDVGPDGRLVFRGLDQIALYDPKLDQVRKLEAIKGMLPRWSSDGRQISYIVPSRRTEDPQAGLWMYDFAQAPRQLFHGWVIWYAWAPSSEIFFVEGKPNLSGSLWRVRPDGSAPVRTSVTVKINNLYWQASGPTIRFDVHPDGRRLVVEALELHDADIGMIESSR